MTTANRPHARTGTDPVPDTTARFSPVQIIALVYAVAFLLVGVAGFIPGLTTSYDSLRWFGHDSQAMLLGVFHVSVLHNAVHLLFGAVGLALFRSLSGARNFLRWGGILYLALWLYGLFVDFDSAANFVPLSEANNWLHLGLGATMVALSFLPHTPSEEHRLREERTRKP
ncbi:DUF4383 domain-containing protein [Corynebacterium guangdongense]|uniref:DUF4383 domain-containing protein n=1 Tax=Corynebacterium guangdongense TaxID=1783348 RepID=A0ABU2A0S7_9CORY|nr:DUF4383 domain-containing protein [Corynebacterium guangdongense]MDR7330788.1 hypothetical protein [Corynebacterium guangdongense]WJZ16803.1 hypothetical protein CGUA_01005 [Corynebacterium guangdongense]